MNNRPFDVKKGQYFHKDKVNSHESVLISPEGRVYSLSHDPKTGKKIILGKGFETVVRAGVEVETKQKVAIKVYPLYKKISAPQQFFRSQLKDEMSQWKLSQFINKKLPNTFVTLKEYFIAGDKSSFENPSHQLMYVITDLYPKNVKSLINDEKITMNEIYTLISAVFLKQKKLMGLGYLYADMHTGNILLDEKYTPVFCDPAAITQATNTEEFNKKSISMLISIMGPRFKGDKAEWHKITDLIIKFVNSFHKNNHSEEMVLAQLADIFNRIRKEQTTPLMDISIDDEDRNEVEQNPEAYGYKRLI